MLFLLQQQTFLSFALLFDFLSKDLLIARLRLVKSQTTQAPP